MANGASNEGYAEGYAASAAHSEDQGTGGYASHGQEDKVVPEVQPNVKKKLVSPRQVSHHQQEQELRWQVQPVSPNGAVPQLGPQVGENIGRKTLVLDLDETLVHSSFRYVPMADILITVEIESEQHPVYVLKRPGVDQFLVAVAKIYEVVVFTASLSKYANPLIDQLDVEQVVAFRLFREACCKGKGSGFIKDLSRLGRDLRDVIIIDNSPTCYMLQPENAIPINTWRDDKSDRELYDLIPILYSLSKVDHIPLVLSQTIWAKEFYDDEDTLAAKTPRGSSASKKSEKKASQ